MDSSNSSRERDQSRICVESIEEWNRVKQNFTDSMVQLLNTKFGERSSTEKDALLAHLIQWRDKTFEIAKPNVRINGINMEEFTEEEEEQELEPYDEVLDRRLWTHFSESLAWQHTLALRRRHEPINAQNFIEDLILREREFEEENTPPYLDINVPPMAPTIIPGLPNELPEIDETHGATLQMLQDWRENLPKLLEKADRVEAVAAVDSRLTP
ncbi:hypothetical protein FRC01_003100 [Tulasnella sp. 417]|nr:hypothetical protein FRC01_003100 [Tulasnella sp. 417]